jgi:hypothetical protein
MSSGDVRLGDLYQPQDPSQGGLAAFETTVVKAPSDTSDLVHVRLYSTDSDNESLDSGGLRWARDGSNLPNVGDACVVQPTVNGGMWVTCWWTEA